ncbi:hypothetical protein FG05_35100 [Fusarium graminearum]|nr:hypothetical protein FG05_35100 [Fusarium graminearum]
MFFDGTARPDNVPSRLTPLDQFLKTIRMWFDAVPR